MREHCLPAQTVSLALWMGACTPDVHSGAPPADSAAAGSSVSFAFDDEGLPLCHEGPTETALCHGWGSRYYTDWVDGSPVAPDWLWRYGDPPFVDFAAGATEDDGPTCADTADEARAVFERIWPSTADEFDEVDSDDSRWFDVVYDRTSVSWRSFRVPRCSVIPVMVDVGQLWPASSGVRSIDPLWTFAALPADRASFFDVSRALEVYRRTMDDGNYDWSIPLAVGSSASETQWAYRTCRLDTRATSGANGGYDHAILQVDYTMTPGEGIARYTIEAVSNAHCDEPIWQPPDW